MVCFHSLFAIWFFNNTKFFSFAKIFFKIYKHMSHIGKNIKKIRSVKKFSQQAFADLFDLSRANIGSYEEGRAEPKISVIMKIANEFGIEVGDLLNKELKVNEISNFKSSELEGNSEPPEMDPDGHGELIPYVSLQNIQTYLTNLDSQDYLKYMPRFQIPQFQYSKARAFEIKGNDLLHHNEGLFSGDILICIHKNANEISSLTEGKLYAFVFSDTVLIRRLYFGHGVFELYADNAFYEEQIVDPANIIELWEAHTLISSNGGVLTDYRPGGFKRRDSHHD